MKLVPVSLEEYFWTKVQFPLKSTKYYANSKTLERFYLATMRSLNSPARLLKFEMKDEDYGNRTITFKDGVDIDESLVFLTLPWFGYKISVVSSTQASSKNISSIVENAIILMCLNGWIEDFADWLKPSYYIDDPLEYQQEGLIWFTKYTLAACCLFYAKHFQYNKDKITIERFLYLCSMNLYQRLYCQGSIEERINAIKKAVFERNKENFISRYGHTHTVGSSIGKKEKQSLSLKKYGEEVDQRIFELSVAYEMSIREIVKTLKEEGINLSKSTIQRKLQEIYF